MKRKWNNNKTKNENRKTINRRHARTHTCNARFYAQFCARALTLNFAIVVVVDGRSNHQIDRRFGCTWANWIFFIYIFVCYFYFSLLSKQFQFEFVCCDFFWCLCRLLLLWLFLVSLYVYTHLHTDTHLRK